MTQRMSATRYARALLDVATAEDDPQAVAVALATTVELFTGHAELWRTVTNPAIPVQKKHAIVEQLMRGTDLPPVLSKLLLLLAGRDRLALLPDLLETYRERLLDQQHVVRADVTTAVPLPDDRAALLKSQLEHLTGRTVQMETSTDTALLGGVIAKLGSTVYDGSVRRQLEKMRERLTGAL